MLWTTEDLARLVQEALEASPAASLVTDLDGGILLVSRELERRLGYLPNELIGQSIEALVPAALRSAYTAHRNAVAGAVMRRPLDAGRNLFGRRKDGSPLALEIELNPLVVRGTFFMLATMIDVPERRALDKDQRAPLERQLAFERFIGRMALQCIDLPEPDRNPAILSALTRSTELIAKDLERGSFFTVDQEGTFVGTSTWAAAGLQSSEWPSDAVFPWTGARVLAGQVVAFSDIDDIPNETDRAAFRKAGAHAAVFLPLHVDDRVAGAVAFQTSRIERAWPLATLGQLYMVASCLALTRRIGFGEAVSGGTTRRREPRREPQASIDTFRRAGEQRVPRVVMPSAHALLMEQMRQVAPTDATVLLLGETGTGKEVVATHIHRLSPRGDRTMIRVNCAAIPATLIESELFGREKGAFTGALARQIGRFELADRSTIFLDEIGDLPPEVHVKLLRAVEERQIERLGSARSISIDTRIIAATHRDLDVLVRDGKFREDLYYRLNVFPLRVPPLRERVDDIPRLVWSFVEEFSGAFGKPIHSIDQDDMAALLRHTWPGNIRELRNAVESAMIVNDGPLLAIPLHPRSVPASPSSTLVEVEREHIRTILERTGWRIRGPGGAAERLGLKPTTLDARMAKFGLKRPEHG